MSPARKPSNFTRRNWEIDFALFLSGFAAIISGIYFLFFPSGGYRGGRNPYYGIVLLFNRTDWENIHIYTGLAMIAAAVIHFAIHWKWVWGMTRRMGNMVLGRCEALNGRGKFNVILDAVVASSFFLAAVSGVYFYFFPESNKLLADPYILGLSKYVWDMIHTWSGVVLTGAAVVHFYIHWNWVTKVTKRYFGTLLPSGSTPVQSSAVSPSID